MIKAEFGKFIERCTSQTLSDNTKKIISLVFGNFEEIEKRTNRHKEDGMNRGDFIAKLIKENIDEEIKFPPVIEQTEATPEKLVNGRKKLRSLTVSNFRGFQEEKSFDFHDSFNLLYGPNGSGKSSFSEALEYGLLGDVKERDNRCKLSIEKYLENCYTKKFDPPKILFKDGDSAEANEDLYRFCFIEKNRILEFVRRKGGEEAIEYLYGYGPFMQFIHEFNDDITANFGKSDITQEEIEKSTKYKQIKSEFQTINMQKETNLKKLKEQVDVLGFQSSSLEQINTDVSKEQKELEEKKQKIQEQITTIEVQDKLKNQPMDRIENNKEATYSTKEKNNLLKRILSSIILVFFLVVSMVYSSFYRLLGMVIIPILLLFWKNIFSCFLRKTISVPGAIEPKINKEKSEIDILREQLKTVISRLEVLKGVSSTIAITENTNLNLNDKEHELKDFESINKQILEDFEKKKEKESRISDFIPCYKKFVKSLIDYMKYKVLSGDDKKALELKTVEVFNMLLGEGRKELQIKELCLPKTGEESLSLKLVVEKEIDPLLIFSEGTLRCLGVSILFAKAIEEKVPFIICDDIVNAIDFDFRRNILKFLLNYSQVSEIQIVLSTHSTNFRDTVKENLGDKDYKEYDIIYSVSGTTFLVGKGKYSEQAMRYLAENNVTDCLHKCRLWLEKIIENICKKYLIQKLSGEFYTSNGSVDTGTKLSSLITDMTGRKDELSIKLVDNLRLIKPGTQFYKYLNEKSHNNVDMLEDVTVDETREIVQSMKTISDLLIDKK